MISVLIARNFVVVGRSSFSCRHEKAAAASLRLWAACGFLHEGNLCLCCCSALRQRPAGSSAMKETWMVLCGSRDKLSCQTQGIIILHLEYNSVVCLKVKRKSREFYPMCSLHVCYRNHSLSLLPLKVADIPSSSKQTLYMLWLYTECMTHARGVRIKCDKAWGC